MIIGFVGCTVRGRFGFIFTKIAQDLSCGLQIVGWDIDGNGFFREENLGGLASNDDIHSLVAEIE